MDRRIISTVPMDEANRRARLLLVARLSSTCPRPKGLAETSIALDEIAAWVNEGGAGGEVRR